MQTVENLRLRSSDTLSTGGLPVENHGYNSRSCPQAPSRPELSTVVHRLSTGYPPGLSPGLGITVRRFGPVVPRTFNRKSTPVHRLWGQR